MSNYDSCVGKSDQKGFFWSLWNDNRGDLYRKCLSMMNWDRDDAEDALSVAMIRAFEKHGFLEEEIRNYRAWFFRITHNVCIDIIRKKKGHQTVSYDSDTFVREELTVEPEELVESTEKVCEEDEMLEHLCSKIMGLPDKLLKPLLLTVFTDLTSDEVSARLKINSANLRKRVQLARNRITGDFTNSIEYKDFNAGSLNPCRFKRFEVVRERALFFSNFTPREIEPDYRKTRFFKLDGSTHPVLQFTSSPGYSDDEVSIIKDYIAKYPGGWKKRLQLAEHYYSIGEFDQALFELQSVNRRYSLSVEAFKRLGDIYRLNGKSAEATEAYKRAMSIVQKDSSRKYFKSLIELTNNRHDEALELIRRAIFLEPDNQVFYNIAGEIGIITGNYNYAEKMFKKTLKIQEDDIKALVYMHMLSQLNSGSSNNVFKYASRISRLDNSLNLRMLNAFVSKKGVIGVPGVEKIS